MPAHSTPTTTRTRTQSPQPSRTSTPAGPQGRALPLAPGPPAALKRSRATSEPICTSSELLTHHNFGGSHLGSQLDPTELLSQHFFAGCRVGSLPRNLRPTTSSPEISISLWTNSPYGATWDHPNTKTTMLPHRPTRTRTQSAQPTRTSTSLGHQAQTLALRLPTFRGPQALQTTQRADLHIHRAADSAYFWREPRRLAACSQRAAVSALF